MKKILILVLFFSCSLFALEDHVSQSFMFTHPAIFNLAMEQATWHNHIYHKRGPVLGSLQVVPFFEKSPHSLDTQNNVAGYFLPDCKSRLLIVGDNIAINGIRDVRAEWLNLPNMFIGSMSIAPEQVQYGALLEYNQDIKKFTDHWLLKYFWFSVSTPIVAVKNNLNLRQIDILNQGGIPGQPKDIIEAFNQPLWKYDKINGELKKVGLAEIKVQLGAALYTKKEYEVDIYFHVTAPTGNKNNPASLFSPFTGYNGHWGMGLGGNFQIPLTRKNTTPPVLFFFNIEHTFLFHNTQLRTFDLFDKQWSRFLLFNSRDGLQVNVPGVNILTRRVKVKPDSFVDLSTGFRIRAGRFEIEAGYDLWAHGEERIELLRTFCDDCDEEVILTDYGIAGSAAGISAHTSTIQNQGPDDINFITLQNSQVNLSSGAAQAAINNGAHLALGYSHHGRRYDGFLNIGAFFEIPQNNADLRRWGIWWKVGASF